MVFRGLGVTDRVGEAVLDLGTVVVYSSNDK